MSRKILTKPKAFGSGTLTTPDTWSLSKFSATLALLACDGHLPNCKSKTRSFVRSFVCTTVCSYERTNDYTNERTYERDK